jgi:hypothetical protein
MAALTMTRTLIALASLLLGACTVSSVNGTATTTHRHVDAGASETDTATDQGAGIDIGNALQPVAGAGYMGSGEFEHLTVVPYASTGAPGTWIDQWVSANGAIEYEKISPDVNGSNAAVPPGTMIVRAVLNGAGQTQKLTLMLKGPAGYNPDLGDWWFGETDAAGNALTGDAGVLTGKLSACYSCHLTRKNDDFLFGVTAAARSAHP